MNEKRVFYQDFLFSNMPVDKQENPQVDIKYIADVGLFPNLTIIDVSLDHLLKMNKESEWLTLYQRIQESIVVIKDDVLIENAELIPYKDFYLKTYFYNISKNCKNCFVMNG